MPIYFALALSKILILLLQSSRFMYKLIFVSLTKQFHMDEGVREEAACEIFLSKTNFYVQYLPRIDISLSLSLPSYHIPFQSSILFLGFSSILPYFLKRKQSAKSPKKSTINQTLLFLFSPKHTRAALGVLRNEENN